MTREDFFGKAKKHGWKHWEKLAGKAKDNFRQELLAYYMSPEGQEDIANAPPWHREASVEAIVDALLSEVD
jgi:hypothetical protein